VAASPHFFFSSHSVLTAVFCGGFWRVSFSICEVSAPTPRNRVRHHLGIASGIASEYLAGISRNAGVSPDILA
jgi:hypothetical protein